jgi:hypothetical protein
MLLSKGKSVVQLLTQLLILLIDIGRIVCKVVRFTNFRLFSLILVLRLDVLPVVLVLGHPAVLSSSFPRSCTSKFCTGIFAPSLSPTTKVTHFTPANRHAHKYGSDHMMQMVVWCCC